jgi:hypothetical protein
MSIRSALVGPFQEVRASAVGEAVNVQPFLEHLERLDVPDLWYSTAIQSGVESLEVVTLSNESSHLSPFLDSRIAYHQPAELIPLFALVSLALSKNIESYDPNEESDELSRLKRFLAELLLATHRKRNLIYFDRLPDVEALATMLPTDLLLPIRNLFSSIISSTPIVATSQSSVAFRDLALFEELVSSKVFRRYEANHGSLDDNNISVEEALHSIRRGSRRLVAQRPRLLKTKRVAVSLLPITSKVIDTIFGKLPGTLADFFVQALATWLQDERRLVIYQFQNLLKYTMESRMNDFLRVKFPNSPNPKSSQQN